MTFKTFEITVDFYEFFFETGMECDLICGSMGL